VKYFEEIMDAKDYVIDRLNKSLPDGKKGYVFVTMGAGDNWKLGKAVFEQISGNK
jgi:UDP-N-acetylmuramate--alanine ligase